jgi:hypothetical protein
MPNQIKMGKSTSLRINVKTSINLQFGCRKEADRCYDSTWTLSPIYSIPRIQASHHHVKPPIG